MQCHGHMYDARAAIVMNGLPPRIWFRSYLENKHFKNQRLTSIYLYIALSEFRMSREYI